MGSYYESQRIRRQRIRITGEGLLSSLKKIITSKAVRDTAKDLARKGLNEAGKKGTELLVKKIIPPKGKGLSDKSKEILSKHTGTIPIEKYVKINYHFYFF